MASDDENVSPIQDETQHGTSPAQNSHSDSVDKIKIAPFWSNKPELWFIMLESQFQIHRVTSDVSKYHAVISRMDQDHLTIIEDLVTKPPTNGKYETIKKALLTRFSSTNEQKFRKLISGLQLGDKKPSFLLSEMESLNAGQLDTKLVRTLWQDQLPKQMQIALASADALDNAAIGQLADKIWEVYQTANSSCVSPQLMAVSKPQHSTSSLETKIDELTNQVKKLINEIRNQKHRSRSNSRQPAKERDVCYYHERFGERATKCTKPCSFTPATPSEN